MDFYRPPTTQGTLEALAAVFRAIRALKFYPKGHPTRRSSLCLAHAAMLQLLEGNMLSLSCGRTGFSFPDGEFLKDPSGLSASFAYELFVRRAQKIMFCNDLFQEDLLELCNILCLSPEVIQQSGGIDAVMAERGIRSIWVNEFDLATIRGKRRKVEQTGIVPLGIDEAETGPVAGPIVVQPSLQADELSPENQLQTLLGRLSTCTDDDIYLRLVRQAVSLADNFQSPHEAHLLLPLLELLTCHISYDASSVAKRSGAQFAIEQIIATGEILQIMLERVEQENGLSKNALLVVLKAGGVAAIKLAVELMASTSNLKTRKTLSSILGALDKATVPALLDLMNDTRWFIIRNICAILGAIASDEAVAALVKCLHHTDFRVRKEAIRSLAQIGGSEAEMAILAILRSADTQLFPQAIASLGGMKSKKSLSDLMKIVFSKDLFLKSLPVKIDALAAIALIGDCQVTPHLVTLLEKRSLLASARRRQLKTAIVACLGKLGDTRALPILEKLVSSGGELGSVSSDAIVMINKVAGRLDGIS